MMKNSLDGHGDSEIVIYRSDDGAVKIDVRMEGETIWLTQTQMAELFAKAKSTINEHIKNIFEEGELDEEDSVTIKFGNPEFNRGQPPKYYNLNMVIAVGYRVKSARGTAFRQWATSVLHEYLQKGYAMNDPVLKNMGGGLYWKELIERIRDIRASEKVVYRQVLDLYATSLDYDPSMPETLEFFKIVQNKLHYAASGNTASEIIFNRANAELPFMGLTTFQGVRPVKSEVTTAKNYMSESELFILHRMVNSFFDMAEVKAKLHEPMYMKDWLETLDTFSQNIGAGVLEGAGSVSHDDAKEKALQEYAKYRDALPDVLSDVEKAYLDALSDMQKRLEAASSKQGE